MTHSSSLPDLTRGKHSLNTCCRWLLLAVGLELFLKQPVWSEWQTSDHRSDTTEWPAGVRSGPEHSQISSWALWEMAWVSRKAEKQMHKENCGPQPEGEKGSG